MLTCSSTPGSLQQETLSRHNQQSSGHALDSIISLPVQDDKDMSFIVTALKMKLASFGWTEQVKRDQKTYTISKVSWAPPARHLSQIAYPLAGCTKTELCGNSRQAHPSCTEAACCTA
jgi:hypothetical protein